MQKLFDIFDHPFLGRGFRPFFFLGAFYGFIMLFIWTGIYARIFTPPDFLLSDKILWHAHEMLYGYTMAIVAGFLLTAVANWTAHAPVRQLHLFMLCLLWLSGRIVMNFDMGLPSWLVYLLSASFVPVLAVSLSVPLLKSFNKRNFIFLGILSCLSITQITFFIFESRNALYIAVMMIMVMISLIGGRIIPAFSVAALRRRGEEAFQTPQPKLDAAALLSLIVVAICFVIVPDTVFLFIVTMVSAAIHILRIRNYHSLRALSDPMLWILHIGFIWLIIGLILLGLSGLGLLPVYLAIHAFTAGALGSMTIGMMVRVALGHTGRNLIAGKLTTAIFSLMQLAAIMRVFMPIILPDLYSYWIICSAGLWSLCFALYLFIYTPILASARPDGRAG